MTSKTALLSALSLSSLALSLLLVGACGEADPSSDDEEGAAPGAPGSAGGGGNGTTDGGTYPLDGAPQPTRDGATPDAPAGCWPWVQPST